MIHMIVATSSNNAIGINNTLPWHIKEDLQYFRAKTSGHAILMGRKTFESIGKPLPNRTNIVLTRDESFAPEGVIVVHNIEEAKQLFPQYPEVYIIGGGQIYKELLPIVDKLWVTLVDTVIDGDTFFPEYKESFKEVSRSETYHDESSNLDFTFTCWDKLV